MKTNKKTQNAIERQKRYLRSDKGKAFAQRRQIRYAETLKGRAYLLYVSAKQRAKKYGLPFTITHENLVEKLSSCNNTCEITGSPLIFEKWRNARQNPYAPSIGQRIPSKGYTPENIQIVALWYNRMKSDLSDMEAIQILLESHEGVLHHPKLEIPHQWSIVYF
jgi:hypothetical protein